MRSGTLTKCNIVIKTANKIKQIINKPVHPDNGILLLRVKKQRAIKTWKDTEEPIMHITNERNQSEKITHCMIPTIWHSGKGKTMETVKISPVAKS